ncbi:flagellar hook-basal body protein [Thalassorhabdus alkalitolerans]|uniref:Flagellar hook-basal body protein n=1 Tax=Thalassorhabdus alkalitolerans TaxID=2282697 RepID=A0ABW0YII8_9BACI
MNTSMITSSVTMGQLQQQLDTISNNLANADRTGYKRREHSFSDLLAQQVNNQSAQQYEGGRLTPLGIRVGSGAKIAQTALRMEQGSIQQTERSLDFALTDRETFFPVQGEEGEVLYTRDGAFYLSPDPANPDQQVIVTGDGNELLSGEGTPFVVPAGTRDFQLTNEGMMEAVLANGESVNIGELELARITKPQLLEGAGGSMFTLPDLAALDIEAENVIELVAGNEAQVQQRALEQSNVDFSKEFADMLNAQRAYSFNARSVSQGDQMMGLINNLR